MASKPKAPKPSKEEVALQQRQREDLAELDEEENIRLKRGMRGQLGSRRLLSGRIRQRSATSAGSSGSGGSGGGGSYLGARRGGGGYATP